MKKLITLILLMVASVATFAQATRGTYGTQTPYTSTTMSIVKTVAGVGTSVAADTLTDGDTGYVYVFISQGGNNAFELLTTTLSGTVATTSNILYGYNNRGSKLTAANVPTVISSGQAYAITGNTTACAGCVGASSTTVPGASKKYTWQVPQNGGALFDNYIIRTIQTGTATATYSGKNSIEY